MDIQKTMMTFLPDPEPLLAKIDTAVDTARAVGIEVIYVVLSFRKGHPEIHPRHKTFSRIKEGADKDYQITVLSDACADPDTEVHDFLVRKIFPASGDVMTTGEWVDSVKS